MVSKRFLQFSNGHNECIFAVIQFTEFIYIVHGFFLVNCIFNQQYFKLNYRIDIILTPFLAGSINEQFKLEKFF